MPKPPPPAPSQATTLGHRPVWDPPAAMTAAARWTCPSPCGATVIRFGRNVYGSATDRPCTRTDQALLLAVMRTDAAVIEDTSKEAAARQSAAYAAAVERWGQAAMERLSAWSVDQRCDAAELVRTAEQQPEVPLRVLVPRVNAAALNLAAAVSRPVEESGVVVRRRRAERSAFQPAPDTVTPSQPADPRITVSAAGRTPNGPLLHRNPEPHMPGRTIGVPAAHRPPHQPPPAVPPREPA